MPQEPVPVKASALQSKALEVLSVVPPAPPGPGSREVDWAKLLQVVVTILKVLFMVFECLAILSPRTVRRIKSPGPLVRWKLRRVLKQVLTREGLESHVDEVYQALLTVGQGATIEDLTSLLNEVLADKTAYSLAASYGLYLKP